MMMIMIFKSRSCLPGSRQGAGEPRLPAAAAGVQFASVPDASLAYSLPVTVASESEAFEGHFQRVNLTSSST
jgi:hypothetical protein